MSKKISEMPAKLSIVPADVITLVDSEDPADETKNKQIPFQNTGLVTDPAADSNPKLRQNDGSGGFWVSSGNAALRNVGGASNEVAPGDAPAAAVTGHETAFAHGNLPTTAQKGAMDAANLPSSGNAFATLNDLSSGGVQPGDDITVLEFNAGDDEIARASSSQVVGTTWAKLIAGGGLHELQLTSSGGNIPSVHVDGNAQVGKTAFLRFGQNTAGNAAAFQWSYSDDGTRRMLASFNTADGVDGIFQFGCPDTAGSAINMRTGDTTQLAITNAAITASLPIKLPGPPTAALDAATKQYVDDQGPGAGWTDGSTIKHWIDDVNALGSVATNQTIALTDGQSVSLTITASITVNFTRTLGAGEQRNWSCRITTNGNTPTFQFNGLAFDTTMSWWDISANATYLVSFQADAGGAYIVGLVQLGAAAA